MMFSIYNAVMIPFVISFGKVTAYPVLVSTIEYVIDCIFLLDLIISFFITRQDSRGYEVRNHYGIFMDYSHSWRFVFDVLALFGMGFFTLISPSFKYF